MREWGRFGATLAIWLTVAISLNNLIERFTRVQADFTGIWPNINYNYPTDMVSQEQWQQWQTLISQTEANAQAIMGQVTASMNAQLSANMGPLLLLSLALIIAATISTAFIWRVRAAEAETESRAASEKSKRSPRVDQLMRSLSEAEWQELRYRLTETDGELTMQDEWAQAAQQQRQR